MRDSIPKFLIVYFLGFCFSLHSQNEFRKWYFGQYAGLDFVTSPPTVLTNGMIYTPEGVATICDSGGNLLFYTDGVTVFNSNHSAMANGSGLAGNGTSTQSGIIIKQPGNNNLYYVFTAFAGNGVKYSIVDMSLAAGLGSVTVKNATLHTSTCEKQVAVRHCNGRDAWIITHDYNSNQFRTFLLSSAGVNPNPVLSSIGETLNGGSGIGHLKISPDGKKLAVATASNSTPANLGQGGFFLFDFDASSGIISNSVALAPILGAYGMEFSPDGKKLYGSTTFVGGNFTNSLFQWDICAPTASAIIASQYLLNLGGLTAGALQWAIDGKIYLAATNAQSLSVINNPNGSGPAMGFSMNALSIAPKMSTTGLPNYINMYSRPAATPFTNTVACQTTSFSVPALATYSSGCSSTPYPPSGYLWNFGEPASGAANSSTLTNPLHTYSATGVYSVSLILFNACTNDTLKQTVTINTAGPSPNVTGTFSICKGEKQIYTATGGTSYLWSNTFTGPTTTLNPSQTTVYTVSATKNGCTLSRSFTVTVDPCLALDEQGNKGTLRIYPNPVNEMLSVELLEKSMLLILDMSGKAVYESELPAGLNDIDAHHLKPGIYMVQAIGATGATKARMVKIDKNN